MSKTTIPTGGITADAIDGTLIADDAISEEHLDATAITGSTELATTPADTDEILISDAGTLKRIDFSHIKTSPYYVQLANVSISDGDSEEVVQSVFSSTYRNYLILLERVAVNTNSADLQLVTIKSDDSTANEHTYGASYSNSSSYQNNWGGINSSNISLMVGQGSGAGKHVSGYFNFFEPNNTTDGVQRFTWHMSARKHDSANGYVIGGGNNATNSARTGFKIKCNSGTLFGGRIVVYGITNPS